MLEEMRWLEYGQRLRRESRGVLRSATGDSAVALLGAATLGGARSLGLEVGAIAAGRWADFVAIDLTAEPLTGFTPETLAAAVVFGAPDSVVAGSYVSGRWEGASRESCVAATR